MLFPFPFFMPNHSLDLGPINTETVSTCTWNPSDKHASTTLSSGNMIADGSGGARGTTSASAGRYYVEYYLSENIGGYTSGAGFATAVPTPGAYNTTGVVAYLVNEAVVRVNGTTTAIDNGTAMVYTDTFSWAFSITAGMAWLAKNNVWVNSGDPETGLNPTITGITGTWYPYCYLEGEAIQLKVSSSDWIYTPPSGYGAWP